jgi:putative ABC transport system permease protein
MDADPIGRRYRTGPSSAWATVVGVVDELRLVGPDEREAPFTVLVPRGPNQAAAFTTIAIATRGDPRPLFPALRTAVHEVDPRQPISGIRLATDAYAEPVSLPRFLLVVMSTLSGIAVVLVMIGIHGLLSYQIVQRRREIGVRIALGATSRGLWRAVAGEGMVLVLAGAVVGVSVALSGAGIIRGVLYGVQPADPVTLLGALAATVVAAGLACVRPVARACRTNPVEVLRAE